MRQISFDAFKPKDLHDIVLREHDREHFEPGFLMSVALTGECQTIRTEDEIIAIIGCFEIRPGVLGVWVAPSIYLPRCAKSVIKGVRGYLARLRVMHHRIESTALADAATDRWMSWLGFTCEGTLRQFTHDRIDYRLWSIVEREVTK